MDDDQPVWQQCVNSAIARAVEAATKDAEPGNVRWTVTAESILDQCGLVCCPMTLHYTRHLLCVIGTPNQPPPIDIPREEAIDAMLKVLFANEHNLHDERQERTLNARRTWRVLKEILQRHELRALLIGEQRRFIREQHSRRHGKGEG
jgi:hypothetical protein